MATEDRSHGDKRRRRLIMTVVIAAGVFLAFSAGFMEYTSRPEFCRSCHFMERYYDSWSQSTHKDIPCGKCHYPPGLKGVFVAKYKAIAEVAMYITGRYREEPRTEVADENCLAQGCHDQRFVNDRVEFKRVIFSHEKHLKHEVRGKKLRCTSCHSQIVQGDHITVTETTCFLCHFKDTPKYEPISGCPSCHTAPEQDIQYKGVVFNHKDVLKQGAECQMCHISVVQGEGRVRQERCYTCHDKPERLAKFNDPEFLHANHVTGHKIDCLNCHEAIYHRKQRMAETLAMDCQQCHPDHHAAQRDLYMGVGGRGVEVQPSAMFLAQVSCKGCHIAHKGDAVIGETTIATERSCALCHGEGYSHMKEQWDQGIQHLLQQIEPAVKLVGDELARLGDRVPQEAQDLYRRAAYNVELVSYGKGVHNIPYAQQLLLRANADLAQALQLARSSKQVPAIRVVSQGGECLTCHFGIETKSVEVYGQRFEHRRHLIQAKLDCNACHTDQPKGQPGHGETPITRSGCAKCHHQEAQVECTTCHETLPGTLQVAGVPSTFEHRLHLEQPDLSCETCHQQGSQRFQGDCVQCHHDATKVDVQERCRSCHEVQAAMFFGTPYQQPSVKAELEFKCTDCHRTKGKITRAVRPKCVSCHEEDGDYAAVLDAIQQHAREELNQAKARIEKLQALLKLTNRPETEQALEKVISDVTFVEADRSKGIHNPELADKLLQQANEQLQRWIGEVSEQIQGE